MRELVTFVLTKTEIVSALQQLSKSNRLFVDTDIIPSVRDDKDPNHNICGYVLNSNGPFVYLLLTNDERRRIIKAHKNKS